MKIALLVPSWPPGFSANGIVTYASQLVPALRRLGHEVFVLTACKATGDDDPYTIDLRGFASPPSLWDRAMFRLALDGATFKAASSAIAAAIIDLSAKHHIDVFEMEESFGWSFEISRPKLLPVIVRLHGPWFLTGKFADPSEVIVFGARREKQEGKGLRHADFVTSPSAKLLQMVGEHYGRSLRSSRVTPNPLDAAAEAETWNAQTCRKESLLFIGRFDKLKGGAYVLRSFAELAPRYPKLTLTFVGPDIGIEEAGGKRYKFEEFVRAVVPEACRSRIHFRGQINRSDVMALRSKHFITVVASQQEIMPYSVLEAMSLGCPVIATDVGGIPELIEDERNGLLVPPRDVGAMTAACLKLLDNHEVAAQLGRQAWRDCGDRHAPVSIARQTVAVYEEAIDLFKFRKRH